MHIIWDSMAVSSVLNDVK
uniref:Uncharacterized protein n=1 Tax=Arundo donax TaxID=35708 RepID=A0A0A9GW99_ARUDO